VGQEAAQNIQSKFDELEQSVDNKESELIDSLAQKYNDNLKQLDARIDEMKAENRGWVDKAKDAIGGVIKTILELKNLLMGVLAKAAGAIDKIIKDPIGFLGNLISGIKQGFQNFAGNIQEHLKKGMVGFLTGALAGAGITMPESFDLKGIFSLVMQVLGVVYDGIKSRVIKALGKNGEKMFTALESSFEMFVILKNEGVAGLWQFIQDKIGDLKAMVIDTIQTFVVESVIKAGVMWVLSLLNPASAFVRACKAIYDIIMFFIERGSQIAELVSAVTESVAAIANGAVGGAAKLIENALGTSLPVVISFMASLLGLGGISEKVGGIIKTVRTPIDKAIDWLIAQGVKFAKKIGNKLGFGKKEEGKGKEKEEDKVKIPDGPVGKPVTFKAPDEGHRLWIELKGGESVVMVASTPQQGEVKLNNIVGEIQGLPNVPPHLLAKARELLRRGYGLLNVTQEQIDQRLDALRTNDNNVDRANIRAEIDRRANSVPQRNELAHVFQELFEILYNATHLPEERSAEGAVAWYHGQMRDTMGSVDERGQDTSGFTTGEGRNHRSHQIPTMLGAVVDRENNNKTYFGMSAGGKQQPNQQRLANAYPPFRDQLRELTPNRPLTNRELTNCAEFELYDKALSARGRDNANLDGLQDSAVLGNARDIKYIPRCDNCDTYMVKSITTNLIQRYNTS
jgi:hypothetical protein